MNKTIKMPEPINKSIMKNNACICDFFLCGSMGCDTCPFYSRYNYELWVEQEANNASKE